MEATALITSRSLTFLSKSDDLIFELSNDAMAHSSKIIFQLYY